MTTTDPEWQAAEQVLTAGQLEALRLRRKGLSWRALAYHLDVSVPTARDRVERAVRKVEAEMRRANGVDPNRGAEGQGEA